MYQGAGAGEQGQGQEQSSLKNCLTQADWPTAIINSITIAMVHQQCTQ